MSDRILRLLSRAIIGLMLGSSVSVAEPIRCPDSISETPTVLSNEKSWIAVVKTGDRPLERVGVYLGSLTEYGAQVPDNTETSKKSETVTWNLNRFPEDSFWIACSYAETSAMLFQPLAASIKQCVATYELLPTGRRQKLAAVNCQ